MSVEDDRIEKLKRKLYSRTEEPVLDVRSPIRPDPDSVNNAWGNDTNVHIPDDQPTHTHVHPFLKKFLFAAGLFFIMSMGVAGYIFFGGGNLISSNNVDIQVAGPSTIASGAETDLNLSLINQNSTDLNFVRLITDYPDGVYADADSNNILTHTEEDVGTITKGSITPESKKLFVFGDKGTTKTIKFMLQYQIAGSNATFTKEKDYDVTIASSPVILTVNAPSQVNSGQEIMFTVSVSSNATAVLKNLLVSVNYPYGFSYEKSSLPLYQGKNTVWNVGDLKSGDHKTFTITGTLTAQNGEERSFQFTSGTAANNPTKLIDTTLASAVQTISVAKPFVSGALSVGGTSAESVAVQAGTSVGGNIAFTNALTEGLSNISVVATLTGSGLDHTMVQANNGGFYQSANNTISWDQNSTQALSLLNPGDNTNLSFSFGTLKLPANSKNPNVVITVVVTGTRAATGGTVTSTYTTTAKISANLVLSARSVRGGVITNTGPIPPKANTPSTYSVDWALTNMWNDVSGATVTATLPAYVDWTGLVSPATANVTYDAASRTVTWRPDSVSAGAGSTVSAREVYFQVRLNPSLSQVGQIPPLTSETTVRAMDNYSGATINFTMPAVTTQTSDGASAMVGQ